MADEQWLGSTGSLRLLRANGVGDESRTGARFLVDVGDQAGTIRRNVELADIRAVGAVHFGPDEMADLQPVMSKKRIFPSVAKAGAAPCP